jgi:transposase
VKEGHFHLNKKELLRKSILDQVIAGKLSLRLAATQLGLSYRQCKRIVARYRVEGAAGLVHRSRDRPSSRTHPQELREKALCLCRDELAGLGPTLAAEKLAERGLAVDHETLRRWLVADGQWQRRRKRKEHRQRRERKERFGEMVQLDGSHHAWFGDEHPHACLMNLVDDATGISMTLMAGQETTCAALRIVSKWVTRYGIPCSIYLDKKSVYLACREPTIEEQLAGETPLTVFGIACKKLGIALITAHSPQAKGRVERKHAVYQDRLGHELRLSGIVAIEGANELLAGGFDDALNEKFALLPKKPQDAHRSVPKRLDLRDIFCTDEKRVVAKDWTISHHGDTYQILRLNHPLPRPGAKVVVRIWLDGSIHLLYRERNLVFRVLPEHQRKMHVPDKPKVKPSSAGKTKPKPAPNHPWREKTLVEKTEK